MMNKLYICFCVFTMFLSSCDTKEDPVAESPFKPFEESGDKLPSNCNVELVSINRITANEVTENNAEGDYLFVLKSVNTVKEKITLEGRYFTGNTAVAIVTVSTTSVGIDETVNFKISSSDITSEEDFDCMEYIIKAEVKDTSNCQWDGNDC